jgi:peptidylprolyl isomerase
MPSSKEVRAAQNRQRERIAAQHAERQRVNARNKRIAIVGGLVLFVAAVAVVLVITLGNSNDNKKAAATSTTPPSTAPPTTAKLTSVKGKPCVGLKAPLPKGSPKFTIPAGPAPTKLTTRDLKAGTGAVIPANATVSVNYVGVACSNGKVFASSYTDGQPFDANLNGGVIKGWTQGIAGMRVGGVRLLAIPSALAYGPQGKAPIAPDEALYFLVAPVKLG